MRSRDETVNELVRLGRLALSIDERLRAYLALHIAACMNWDEQEMQTRRDEVHAVIDSLLDNAESIHRLTAELERLR